MEKVSVKSLKKCSIFFYSLLNIMCYGFSNTKRSQGPNILKRLNANKYFPLPSQMFGRVQTTSLTNASELTYYLSFDFIFHFTNKFFINRMKKLWMSWIITIIKHIFIPIKIFINIFYEPSVSVNNKLALIFLNVFNKIPTLITCLNQEY